MSMTTSVKLLRSKDDPQYQKYLKIFTMCMEAEVDIPADVDEYFGGYGVDNNLEDRLVIPFEPRPYKADLDMIEGYEIDLADLPEGVKTIRFTNSW